MVQKRVIVMACDLCSTEGETVATHRVQVDRKSVVLDACARCWTKADKVLAPMLKAGRREKKS